MSQDGHWHYPHKTIGEMGHRSLPTGDLQIAIIVYK